MFGETPIFHVMIWSHPTKADVSGTRYIYKYIYIYITRLDSFSICSLLNYSKQKTQVYKR